MQCNYILESLLLFWRLTWPVPVEGAGVVVCVDWAGRVAVGLAVHRQVTVAGYGDPLGGTDGVVVDRFAVRVCGQELGEHTAAGRPVSLFSPEVFRSCYLPYVIIRF